MMAKAPSKTKTSAASTSPLVGREAELNALLACLSVGRNVLLEGPVGVGKTYLALRAVEKLKRAAFRIDGDSRFSEQKLAGWFDPPLVLKKGYGKASFVPGPLVSAMESGGILFINELNRLPEGVQNILLPAIDEGLIQVPRLGELRAKPGFAVIATQNPKEFVATTHLSEAVLDRFELVRMDYPEAAEEVQILTQQTEASPMICQAAVALIRLTRNTPGIRRGASIRAGLSIAELTHVLMKQGSKLRDAFLAAAALALPTRVEIDRSVMETEVSGESLLEIAKKLLLDLAEQALAHPAPSLEKKKSL